MMSKTHIAVGVAASLAVCMPATIGGIFSAVAGGAVGAILCDIECRSSPQMRDALYGRIIVAGIAAVILSADWFFNTGIWARILAQSDNDLIVGAVVLLVTCLLGRFSPHRSFTHSLLYVVLISFGFYCISPSLSEPVFVGGLSHLIIDTFNKKPVPWLYPLRKTGICFKVCYASRIGNSIFMWLGTAACIALLVWRTMVAVGKA